MPSFEVRWLKRCQDQLAQIWLQAPDRQAVTAAAARIDRELAYSPQTNGVDEAEGFRRLHVPPLSVLFEVQPERQRVIVASVKTMADRSNGPGPS